MTGLLILTCTSIPESIHNGSAFPGFIVGIIICGLGTGGIKANVSPLVAEQYQSRKPFVRTLKDGSRVIVTPQATYQKIFNMFYWSINIGGLSAIATTNLEKNVGFWAAYLLPTLMFIPCMIVVLAGRKYYKQSPPRGSIYVDVEGWRGTLVQRVELAPDGTLNRVKIVDPSFFNWPALPVALTAHQSDEGEEE